MVTTIHMPPSPSCSIKSRLQQILVHRRPFIDSDSDEAEQLACLLPHVAGRPGLKSGLNGWVGFHVFFETGSAGSGRVRPRSSHHYASDFSATRTIDFPIRWPAFRLLMGWAFGPF